MPVRECRTIELTEGVGKRFARDELSEELADAIYRTGKIEVGFPSPVTGYGYELCSSGIVGQVPVGRDVVVRVAPKVPIRKLFRMLEYAYNLKSFGFSSGLVDVESLPDLYERLASILARRVLDRIRKGLYRTYLRDEDALPYVRGRIELPLTLRLLSSGHPRLHCCYEEHTTDVDESQILLWTMHVISRMPLERPDVRAQVRAARLALSGAATVRTVDATEAANRLYNRLNDDYRPMHALCRFFLENAGPGHDRGPRDVVPFTVDMARLFESFLAEWLRAHAPARVRVRKQHQVILEGSAGISFRMDVALYDRLTGRALAVIDAKVQARCGTADCRRRAGRCLCGPARHHVRVPGVSKEGTAGRDGQRRRHSGAVPRVRSRVRSRSWRRTCPGGAAAGIRTWRCRRS